MKVEFENIFYLIMFIEVLIIPATVTIRGRINILKIRFNPI